MHYQQHKTNNMQTALAKRAMFVLHFYIHNFYAYEVTELDKCND